MVGTTAVARPLMQLGSSEGATVGGATEGKPMTWMPGEAVGEAKGWVKGTGRGDGSGVATAWGGGDGMRFGEGTAIAPDCVSVCPTVTDPREEAAGTVAAVEPTCAVVTGRLPSTSHAEADTASRMPMPRRQRPAPGATTLALLLRVNR
ncbi:hypothetical protein D3C72_927160 [compost metagenome]